MAKQVVFKGTNDGTGKYQDPSYNLNPDNYKNVNKPAYIPPFQTTFFQENPLFLLGTKTDNGVATIYTVPVGKIFYLISANLSSSVTNAGGNAITYLSATGYLIVLAFNQAGMQAESLNPSLPLAFPAGTIFRVNNDITTGHSAACIQGYLLPIDAQF
jgi:hypothetical protein